jgi:hypothetical protein
MYNHDKRDKSFSLFGCFRQTGVAAARAKVDLGNPYPIRWSGPPITGMIFATSLEASSRIIRPGTPHAVRISQHHSSMGQAGICSANSRIRGLAVR